MIFVSIIIPCLNEEKAIGKCVREMREIREIGGIRERGGRRSLEIKTEVIVVDNGSRDRTAQAAKKAGAKVIIEKRKGYGRALLTGLEKARGEYLVFADGDGSYDLRETGKLLEKLLPDPSTSEESLRATSEVSLPLSDLVIGSRLQGKIEKGAMPFFHRYLGTPFLNFLFSLFFKQKISDVNSGFRGISKQAFNKLKLYSTGMEFASEMLYKAGKLGLKIGEVHITYKKRIGKSKLSPFRDAWRHIKFMLLFCPTWLFLVPGGSLGLLGFLGMLWLLPGKQFFLGRFFDIHSLVAFSFMILVGFQIVFLGLFAKVFAVNFMSEKNDKMTIAMMRFWSLEKGIGLGGAIGGIGVIGVIRVIGEWWGSSFGPLSQERLLIFSLTFLVLGIEIIFSSFFFGILGREER